MKVDWRHGRDHMWDHHGVTVAQADQALADPDALWADPDPKSRSGTSIRVIGYSPARRQILTIILVREDGVAWLWGANAWPSNSTDRRLYHEGSQA